MCSPVSSRGEQTKMLMLKLAGIPLGDAAEVKEETLRCFWAVPWLTIAAILFALGGRWITLPKGAKLAGVRGTALIVRGLVGGVIVATVEVMVVVGVGSGGAVVRKF